MTADECTRFARILASRKDDVLSEWLRQQLAPSSRRGLVTESEMRHQFASFLDVFVDTLCASDSVDAERKSWDPVRAHLTNLAARRARQGFTAADTAKFIFSLKPPMFKQMSEAEPDAADLAFIILAISLLFDSFGLFAAEAFSRSHELIIVRQRQELLELSTPVIELWTGILGLPLIGTLDSERTQVVMESLLQKIVEASASVAIIDITGVSMVDTLVAQHLLKTVAAARLMGADCIISGVRPQIAQTIVHLGVDLSNIITKASLADALVVALKMFGRVSVRDIRSSSRAASR